MDPVAYAVLRSGLFGVLPLAAFNTLLAGLVMTPVAAGEVVVHEGEPADACYVVASGLLQVVARATDGTSVNLTTLRARDHFGEQALLRGDALRAATVVALEPSEVVRIGFDHLEEVFRHAPELREQLATIGRLQLEERLSRRTDLVRHLLAAVDTRPAERMLPNGHVLYRAGEPAAAVYVILSGAIELFEERAGVPVLVARVGPGLCVGERDTDARSQTAVVDGPTRVLQVSRAALAEITTGSPEARDHLATLERAWELPQRGLVTQHLGVLDGQPCLSQIFHLADGQTFVSSHVLGGETVRLQAGRGRAIRTISTPDDTVRVGLEADGRLVAIDAQSSVPVLAALYARAIEGRPLTPAEAETLGRTGQIIQEIEGFACTCLRVTRARIRDAMAAGAHTLDALKQRTGCAMACGSCVPGLLEILGQTTFQPVRIGRRQIFAPDVIRVFLDGENLPAARPGQHVVLRAVVDGERIERPYTLAGAAGGAWEIMARREGRFTGWLFDHAPEGTALEASSPQGTWIWDAGPAPIVCLVSGIGLTPALCFARTLLREGWPHALVFDWSTRHERDVALLAELPAARAANFLLKPRFTGSQGRITVAEVEAYPRRYPGAQYFLCGSEGYLDAVTTWLRKAGVPAARILVESFSPT